MCVFVDIQQQSAFSEQNIFKKAKQPQSLKHNIVCFKTSISFNLPVNIKDLIQNKTNVLSHITQPHKL